MLNVRAKVAGKLGACPGAEFDGLARAGSVWRERVADRALPATTIPDAISTPTRDEAGEPPDDAGETGVEADSQLMQNVPGRPDAPAAEGEDFRSDPPSLVGNTGRPQLVEFFTYW